MAPVTSKETKHTHTWSEINAKDEGQLNEPSIFLTSGVHIVFHQRTKHSSDASERAGDSRHGELFPLLECFLPVIGGKADAAPSHDGEK